MSTIDFDKLRLRFHLPKGKVYLDGNSLGALPRYTEERLRELISKEWADELVGGILASGSTRLEAAARNGVPAVIAPGCLDMVNFGPRDTIPGKFAGRLFYEHNPQVTLMRTTPDECYDLGRILAEKANLSTGPCSLLIPTRAISVISAPGQFFHDPSADQALFAAIKSNLRKDIDLQEISASVNDFEFARLAAETLLAFLRAESTLIP